MSACAGIDVSKRDAKVCVRVQGRGSAKTTTMVTTWSSTMPQILKLQEQLVADGVELAVVESTSDYWRPFFYILSEALPVMLVKASDVKAMPGRKSDVSDADWLYRPTYASLAPPRPTTPTLAGCGTHPCPDRSRPAGLRRRACRGHGH